MRVLIAPDKFRGSLTAQAACQAMARGVRAGDPDAVVDLIPMADGGEGTLDALVAATGGTIRPAQVLGPLGDPVSARWGVLGDGATAIIEAAEAVGHAQVPPGRRDVMRASTFGVGQLIRLAFEAGLPQIVVAVGGTATMDGGAGLAQALGYRLLDRAGREIRSGGGDLAVLDRIDPSAATRALRSARIAVASDVANLLCGPDGAAAVFGPQKGATPSQVALLDYHLAHLAAIIRRDLGSDVLGLVGGGAAGGLAAGLVAFAGAEIRSGADLVAEAVGLADRLRGADLCLTGEGRLDASTAAGKAVAGVAAAALAQGVPVVALAGSVADWGSGAATAGLPLTARFAISPGPTTLDEALPEAHRWLADAAEQVVRVFLAGRSSRPGTGGDR